MATLKTGWLASNMPGYVLANDSYDRIKTKLLGGAPSVPSYIGMCPHRRRADCDCPQMDNVLRDGKVVRIHPTTGAEKPVLPLRDMASTFGVVDVPVANLWASMAVARGEDYVRHVKSFKEGIGMVFPATVKLHFDHLAGGGDTVHSVTVPSAAEFDALAETFLDMSHAVLDL